MLWKRRKDGSIQHVIGVSGRLLLFIKCFRYTQIRISIHLWCLWLWIHFPYFFFRFHSQFMWIVETFMVLWTQEDLSILFPNKYYTFTLFYSINIYVIKWHRYFMISFSNLFTYHCQMYLLYDGWQRSSINTLLLLLIAS